MVVHAPYPLGETRVEREAHAAQEHGWDVDVVAMRATGESAVETARDGVRIFRLPVRRARGASAATVAREYARFTILATLKVAALHRRRRYAVVQVHNPPDFLVVAGVIPRLRGAKVVLDVHDLAPELFALRFGSRRGSGILLAVLSAIERAALRFVDAVVTVHEPYRRLLVQRGVPRAKIVVALNSPDEQLLPPPAPAAPGSRIVYHGTITQHYGLDSLVIAVAELRGSFPKLVVDIYGGGDALEEVEARARALGLVDTIRFSGGFVDNREVLELVRGAQVGVVANLAIERNKAAVPTKLFEYAALKIPIVSSDLPAVCEYFTDDEVRFFTAGDPGSLARAIAGLLEDPAAAAAQAERAHSRYQSYRWGVNSADYAAMLDALAAGTFS
jgi:glycosyltransferase involved in cell wall biosynthesis